MVFGMIVAPGLAKLSPETRSEFVLKVVPKYVRYILSFALFTLVFGVGSVFTFANGNLSIMSPSTSFGVYISAGALVALVAFAIGVGIVIPSANKMVKIVKGTTANPGPSAELRIVSERMRLGSILTMILLIVVTILMVAAATL